MTNPGAEPMTERDEMVALAEKIAAISEYGSDVLLNPDNAKTVVSALRSAARTDAGYGAGFEACRDVCKRAVAGELLQDCTGTPDDIAYNNAIHCALDAIAALPAPCGITTGIDFIDALAQEIRRVDGSNSLGAAALAEALAPFLATITHKNEDVGS